MAAEYDPSEIFRDSPSNSDPVAALPRDEMGRARVAAFTPPARTSAELEEIARLEQSEEWFPEFIAEDGTVELDPFSESERRDLKEQFSPEEWAEIEAAMKG